MSQAVPFGASGGPAENHCSPDSGPTNEADVFDSWNPMADDYGNKVFNAYAPPSITELKKTIPRPGMQANYDGPGAQCRSPDGDVRLFINGIPTGMTQEGLRGLFTQVGKVVYCSIARQREVDQQTTFGFVGYNSFREADNAIRKFDGFVLGENMRLRVQLSKKKKTEEFDSLVFPENIPLIGHSSSAQENSVEDLNLDLRRSSQSSIEENVTNQGQVIQNGTAQTNGNLHVTGQANPEAVSIKKTSPVIDPLPCTRCGVTGVKRCGGCKAPYCSKRCQQEDWSTHKTMCTWKKTATSAPQTQARLPREALQQREHVDHSIKEKLQPLVNQDVRHAGPYMQQSAQIQPMASPDTVTTQGYMRESPRSSPVPSPGVTTEAFQPQSAPGLNGVNWEEIEISDIGKFADAFGMDLPSGASNVSPQAGSLSPASFPGSRGSISPVLDSSLSSKSPIPAVMGANFSHQYRDASLSYVNQPPTSPVQKSSDSFMLCQSGQGSISPSGLSGSAHAVSPSQQYTSSQSSVSSGLVSSIASESVQGQVNFGHPSPTHQLPSPQQFSPKPDSGAKSPLQGYEGHYSPSLGNQRHSVTGNQTPSSGEHSPRSPVSFVQSGVVPDNSSYLQPLAQAVPRAGSALGDSQRGTSALSDVLQQPDVPPVDPVDLQRNPSPQPQPVGTKSPPPKPYKRYYAKDTPSERIPVGPFDMMATHVSSPTLFWIQVCDDAPNERKRLIFNLLHQMYSNTTYDNYVPSPDELCVAMFTADNCWYRAKVNYIGNNGLIRVTYIDFGNSEDIEVSRLRRITEELVHFPKQALKSSMYFDDQNVGLREWTAEAANLLKSKILGNLTKAEFRKQSGSIYSLDVYDNADDSGLLKLNAMFKEERFALKAPPQEEKPPKVDGEAADGRVPLEEARASSPVDKSTVSPVEQKVCQPLASPIHAQSISPIPVPEPLEDAAPAGPYVDSPRQGESAVDYYLRKESTNPPTSSNTPPTEPLESPTSHHMPRDIREKRSPRASTSSDAVSYMSRSFEVTITQAESPWKFTAKKTHPELNDQIETLVKDLNSHCNAEPAQPDLKLKQQEPCAAKILAHNSWLRATVLGESPGGYFVKLIDIGTKELVSKALVRAIPQRFREPPPLTFTGSLAWVRKLDMSQGWGQETIVRFLSLVLNKTFMCRDLKQYYDTHIVDLLDDAGESIVSNTLINEGLAGKYIKENAPTNTPVVSPHANAMLTSKLPERGELFKVVATEILSPTQFFVQIADHSIEQQLKSLCAEMNAHYIGSTAAGNWLPRISEVCAASSKGAWYRVFVEEITPDRVVKAYFVDYGNTEVMGVSALRPLASQFSSLRHCALKCSLPFVIWKTGNDWSPEAVQLLKSKMPISSPVTAKLVKRSRTIMFIDVVDAASPKSEFVSQVLIAIGLAVKSHKGSFPKERPGISPPHKGRNATSHSGPPSNPGVASMRIAPDSKMGRSLQKVQGGVPFSVYSCALVSREIPKLKEQFTAMVTEVVSPGEFFIQLANLEKVKLLAKLSSDMDCYYGSLSPQPFQPNLNTLCAAKFSQSDEWYRAYVEEIKPDGNVRVFYVDYGNREILPGTSVRSLKPEFAKLPHYALHCSLAHVKPVGGTWTREATSFFQTKVPLNTPSAARIFFRGRDCLVLDFYDGNHPVSQALVDEKYAVKFKDFNSNVPNKGDMPYERKDRVEKAMAFPVQEPKSDILKAAVSSASLPDAKCEFEALVTEIVDPWCFFIQTGMEMARKLGELSSRLNNHYNTIGYPSFQPVEHQLCAAPFGSSTDWFRAFVERINLNGTAQVYYVDFGNTAEVPVSELRPIEDRFSNVPYCAMRCSLAYVVPRDADAWSEEAIAFMKSKLPLEKALKMKLVSKRDEFIIVNIRDVQIGEDSLSTLLQKNGLADNNDGRQSSAYDKSQTEAGASVKVQPQSHSPRSPKPVGHRSPSSPVKSTNVGASHAAGFSDSENSSTRDDSLPILEDLPQTEIALEIPLETAGPHQQIPSELRTTATSHRAGFMEHVSSPGVTIEASNPQQTPSVSGSMGPSHPQQVPSAVGFTGPSLAQQVPPVGGSTGPHLQQVPSTVGFTGPSHAQQVPSAVDLTGPSHAQQVPPVGGSIGQHPQQVPSAVGFIGQSHAQKVPPLGGSTGPHPQQVPSAVGFTGPSHAQQVPPVGGSIGQHPQQVPSTVGFTGQPHAQQVPPVGGSTGPRPQQVPSAVGFTGQPHAQQVAPVGGSTEPHPQQVPSTVGFTGQPHAQQVPPVGGSTGPRPQQVPSAVGFTGQPHAEQVPSVRGSTRPHSQQAPSAIELAELSYAQHVISPVESAIASARLPNLEEPFPAVVTDITNPGKFSLQIADMEMAQQFASLTEELEAHYSTVQYPPYNPSPNQFCAAQFTLNNKWYRGYVENCPSGGLVEVYYPDYGNSEVLSISRLRPLEPQFLSLPFSALKCSLACPPPVPNQWPDQASELFKTCVPLYNVITVKVVQRERNCLFVDVLDADKGSICGVLQNQFPTKSRDDVVTGATNAAVMTGPVEHSRIPTNAQSTHAPQQNEQLGGPPQPSQELPVAQPPVHHPIFLDSLPLVEIPQEEYFSLLTSDIRTRGDLSFQIINEVNVRGLFDISKELNNHCTNVDQQDYYPQAGELCCALFKEDLNWYRAVVDEVLPSNQFKVTFVDFGNQESVGPKDIRRIPESFCQLPRQSRSCTLTGLVPNEGSWDESMMGILNDKILNKQLLGRVIGSAEAGLTLELFESVDNRLGTNINQEIWQMTQPVVKTPQVVFPQEDIFDAVVTEVLNPGEIWVQLQDEQSATSLANLMNEIGIHSESNAAEPLSAPPAVGDFCLCKFSIDGNWYRVKVLQVSDGQNITVQYVDYGNSEAVPIDRLRKPLPQHLELPIQAIGCFLMGVAPTPGQQEWSSDAVDWIQQIITRQLRVKVLDRQPEMIGVQLEDHGVDGGPVNIGEYLTDFGYAARK